MALKRRKYGNNKPIYNGVKFDSELELSCYQLLSKLNIPFKWQVEYELQPNFKSWEGKGIRRIYMKIDFVVKMPDGKLIIFDTKGFADNVAPLKYKMLEYRLITGKRNYELHWLKTKKEVKNFVLDLYDKLKNNPQ
jgi:hypothetical protein